MRRCPWRQGCAIDNVCRKLPRGHVEPLTKVRPLRTPAPPGGAAAGEASKCGRRRAQAEAWLDLGRPLALFAKKVQQQHRAPALPLPSPWGEGRGLLPRRLGNLPLPSGGVVATCGRPLGGAKRRAAGSSGPIGLPAGVSATPARPAGWRDAPRDIHALVRICAVGSKHKGVRLILIGTSPVSLRTGEMMALPRAPDLLANLGNAR